MNKLTLLLFVFSSPIVTVLCMKKVGAPLSFALIHNNKCNEVSAELKKGANPNMFCGKLLPLNIAVGNGSKQMVVLLLFGGFCRLYM